MAPPWKKVLRFFLFFSRLVWEARSDSRPGGHTRSHPQVNHIHKTSPVPPLYRATNPKPILTCENSCAHKMTHTTHTQVNRQQQKQPST
eukprot:1221529-Rhodomonas_salina.1